MSTSDVLVPSPPTSDPGTPRRRPYGAIVAGALLVVVGLLWLLDAAGAIELRAAIVLPAILAVIGLALIFGAFDGPHPGLVVAGVFVTIASLAVAVAPPDAFHGGIGQRRIHVTDPATLAPAYDVGVGELRLDLSDLELTEPTELDLTVGAGDVSLTLPPDVAVDISASAGAGRVDLLGQESDGLSVHRTYVSDDFETAEVTLTVDIDVAAGNIEVEQ
jgi:predicted membrane protein